MSEVRNNRDLRNKVGGFLFGFSFATFLVFLFFVHRWAHLAPTMPNRALQQLYPHNEHGSVTYFTPYQSTSSALMFWLCFVGIVMAIATMPKREIKVMRLGRLPLAASWKHDDERGLMKFGFGYGLVAVTLVAFSIGPMLVGWVVSRGIVLEL